MKLKIKQAAFKRFKVTKTGKVIRGHQLSRHLRQSKSAGQKRRQAEPARLKGKFAKTIKRMLGK